MRQHLTAVDAAVQVGGAEVQGAFIGSKKLIFKPGTIRSGQFKFCIGSAGSVTLVLQTVLPALMLATGKSELFLEGGTHNPFAPPWDFLAKTFLPVVNRMGVTIKTELSQYGFYPEGGGRFRVNIDPAKKLNGIDLTERGEVNHRVVRALVANLPSSIGHRECKVVAEKMGWTKESMRVEEIKNASGPGNALIIEIGSELVTEIVTGFGERGVTTETIAANTASEAKRYLESDVPVGVHLADQLMIPFALAKSGSYVTMSLSRHSHTNLQVISSFLDTKISVETIDSNKKRIFFA